MQPNNSFLNDCFNYCKPKKSKIIQTKLNLWRFVSTKCLQDTTLILVESQNPNKNWNYFVLNLVNFFRGGGL